MAAHWYVVHVYSGSEKKVAESLREQAVLKNMEDKILEVMVPTENIVEIKKGSRVNSEVLFRQIAFQQSDFVIIGRIIGPGSPDHHNRIIAYEYLFCIFVRHGHFLITVMHRNCSYVTIRHRTSQPPAGRPPDMSLFCNTPSTD